MWGRGRQSRRAGFSQVLPRCDLAGQEQNLHSAKITAVTKVDLLSPEVPSFSSSRYHGVCRLPANSASDEADSEGNNDEGRGEKPSLPVQMAASPLPWHRRSASDLPLLLIHQIICLLYVLRQLGPAGVVEMAQWLSRARCREAERKVPHARLDTGVGGGP